MPDASGAHYISPASTPAPHYGHGDASYYQPPVTDEKNPSSITPAPYIAQIAGVNDAEQAGVTQPKTGAHMTIFGSEDPL